MGVGTGSSVCPEMCIRASAFAVRCGVPVPVRRVVHVCTCTVPVPVCAKLGGVLHMTGMEP
jgi:hypothetical protein